MNRQHPLRRMLRVVGAGRALLHARETVRMMSNRAYWRSRVNGWQLYANWRWKYRDILMPPLYPPGSPKRALIVTKGTMDGMQIEMALIKGLERGGFVPTVLSTRHDLIRHYRLGGVTRFLHWDQFWEPAPIDEARRLVADASGVEALAGFEHAGARVGKFALSTTFRSLRVGTLDFSSPLTRERLAKFLAQGMARAASSRRIIEQVKPDLTLFMGNRYTGHGEMMDICLAAGVDVLTWFDSHRSSALMLKRYRQENRDWHHGSLSDATWQRLRAMPWGGDRRDQLRRELHDNYAAGDWYSRGGTQVNKSILATEAIRSRLKLDPDKKTAVIFPHIVWDATLFWGTDLFANYEEWMIATVRAACANPRVNWVIKIHPVHVQKKAIEGYAEAASEMTIIRDRLGPLPDHVKLIPPDTDINTYSLFGVMDYCLTVRGTIGIEAACLGIPVLLAGTGRYDHRGFTIDSQSRDEYLHRLATIEQIPALTMTERELAERFAYGAFVLRPLPLTSFTIEHGRDRRATQQVRINAPSSEALRDSADLIALGNWAADRTCEDFLWEPAAELPVAATVRHAS